MSLPRAAQAASVEGSGGYVPPNAAPARITDLAATSGPGSITLTFTPPSDNGTSITEYRVYRTVDDVATSFTTHSGATGPIVVDVLDPTVAYTFSVAAMNVHGEAERSLTVADTPGAVATGGTVTYFTADGTNGTNGITYAVHTFVDGGGSAINTNLVLNASRSVDYLVVAGGGSGGTAGTDPGVWGTGGGGAGGVRQGSGLALSVGTYAVAVGGSSTAPAATNNVANSQGNTGNASSFDTVTATGGGAGAAYGRTGGNGGSGGGGGGRESKLGGTGTSGQGNNGGSSRSGTTAGTSGGGGGGGAGATGSNGGGTSGSSSGGSGGVGIQSSVDGTSRYYAGGGGGGASHTSGTETAGSGGLGGGGAGSTSGNATSGTNGTGGGGGGVGIGSGTGAGRTGAGGSGGSGIVVVRYPITKLTY